MGWKDIRAEILLATIAQLPSTFSTKDVSERADMRAAHPAVVSHSHYHAFVGSALKRLVDERGELVLDELRKGTPRGSVWSIRGGVTQTPTKTIRRQREDSPALPPGPPASELGPQSSGDRPFTAKMRRHQSWYRSQILKVPCGTGPTRTGRE